MFACVYDNQFRSLIHSQNITEYKQISFQLYEIIFMRQEEEVSRWERGGERKNVKKMEITIYDSDMLIDCHFCK